jgi:hypothetical protein
MPLSGRGDRNLSTVPVCVVEALLKSLGSHRPQQRPGRVGPHRPRRTVGSDHTRAGRQNISDDNFDPIQVTPVLVLEARLP